MKFLRYSFSAVVLLIGVGACSHFVAEQKQGFAHYILTADQKPTPALANLLERCSIKHENTLASMVVQTQKVWFRPAGVERFHMADAYADRKAEFMPLFKKLGVIDEVKPSKKRYCYCLVHGASVCAARVRIAYAIKLWNEGVRFDELVFLAGQRVLDPVKESDEILCDHMQKVLPIRVDWKKPEVMPTTESAMMRMVYDQAEKPYSLTVLPFKVIDVPYQETESGTKRRPNTQDTVRAWVKTNPMPGAVLAISNQPYLGYQDATIRFDVPTTLAVETVGARIDEDEVSVAVFLDNLARWLYQEKALRLKLAH